jgi:hypothetical protein
VTAVSGHGNQRARGGLGIAQAASRSAVPMARVSSASTLLHAIWCARCGRELAAIAECSTLSPLHSDAQDGTGVPAIQGLSGAARPTLSAGRAKATGGILGMLGSIRRPAAPMTAAAFLVLSLVSCGKKYKPMAPPTVKEILADCTPFLDPTSKRMLSFGLRNDTLKLSEVILSPGGEPDGDVLSSKSKNVRETPGTFAINEAAKTVTITLGGI